MGIHLWSKIPYFCGWLCWVSGEAGFFSVEGFIFRANFDHIELKFLSRVFDIFFRSESLMRDLVDISTCLGYWSYILVIKVIHRSKEIIALINHAFFFEFRKWVYVFARYWSFFLGPKILDGKGRFILLISRGESRLSAKFTLGSLPIFERFLNAFVFLHLQSILLAFLFPKVFWIECTEFWSFRGVDDRITFLNVLVRACSDKKLIAIYLCRNF